MPDSSPPRPRLIAATGALLAAASVALAAYAAHAAAPGLQAAAWLGLIHGAFAAASGTDAGGKTGRLALLMLLAGAFLFAGSLAGKHFFGLPSAAAPAGGLLMIAGWLLYAIARFKR